jgi:hypothetical protein
VTLALKDPRKPFALERLHVRIGRRIGSHDLLAYLANITWSGHAKMGDVGGRDNRVRHGRASSFGITLRPIVPPGEACFVITTATGKVIRCNDKPAEPAE